MPGDGLERGRKFFLTCRGPVYNKCDLEPSLPRSRVLNLAAAAMVFFFLGITATPSFSRLRENVPRLRDAWNATAG